MHEFLKWLNWNKTPKHRHSHRHPFTKPTGPSLESTLRTRFTKYWTSEDSNGSCQLNPGTKPLPILVLSPKSSLAVARDTKGLEEECGQGSGSFPEVLALLRFYEVTWHHDLIQFLMGVAVMTAMTLLVKKWKCLMDTLVSSSLQEMVTSTKLLLVFRDQNHSKANMP